MTIVFKVISKKKDHKRQRLNIFPLFYHNFHLVDLPIMKVNLRKSVFLFYLKRWDYESHKNPLSTILHLL